MLTKPIPVNLLEITWDDAETDSNWDNEAETEIDDSKDALVLTVGFLVKETKTAYYISHTISTDEQGDLHWNGRIRIPKPMVKKLKILQKGA